ncbi:MAG: DNA adenine methylase [Gammaproteobacteria bacterium]|nr:DNA adenine methylase [Gammaproteobacteria bacterium]
MIEKHFDVAFIADLALREKQVQQNYRPVIAVHKWFARRPGSLFRGLLLSEFSDRPLQEAFYRANKFSGLHVADPFMGGGTTILEANRIGCNVTGFDINPMSYWIVKQEIGQLDLGAYAKAAGALRADLEKKIGQFYRTRCMLCGSNDAHVKYFLWVKTKPCNECGKNLDLFPGYLLAADVRHPRNVFICPVCRGLTETGDRKAPGRCNDCAAELLSNSPAKRGRCRCSACGFENRYPDANSGVPEHRLFAIEYYCPRCKPLHAGRFFKKPDEQDMAGIVEVERRWSGMRPGYVPDERIPSGDETDRLYRWGYRRYREMFNSRQLLGLELSARFIAKTGNERIRNALATNFSDLLRYQNMLCRYDTRALKSLDIFSVHGFPAGLIQCESNFLGIMEPGRNTCVGSGGWANMIEKFNKAKSYCEHPFEIRYRHRSKTIVSVPGEWIGEQLNGDSSRPTRMIALSCRDAASARLPAASLDAVFTDPPYFGNVQYAELIDFCYVWLRKLVGRHEPAFRVASTRTPDELTGNVNMGRGLDHFAQGLSSVFRRMAGALKPGAPLVFTYHHNRIEAYYPVAVAVLDAGLTCSASLPCPAEMSASIHINGTGSSIIDTVFVCRKTGTMRQQWLAETPDEVAHIVQQDLERLMAGNVKPAPGDIKCVAYGHLIRLAIWSLRRGWRKSGPVTTRIARIADWLRQFGGEIAVQKCLARDAKAEDMPLFATHEKTGEHGAEYAGVSF